MLEDMIIVDDRQRPRSQVVARGKRATSAFVALGAGSGKTIAILMRNDFAFLEATLGVQDAGAFCVPLNWHSKPAELEYVLRDCQPTVLVGHADLLLPLKEVIPDGMHVVVVPNGEDADAVEDAHTALREIPNAHDWSRLLEAHPAWSGEPQASSGVIIYTSGTTGKPKGVRKQPMSPVLLAEFRASQTAIYGITTGSRAMILGPLYHASPEAHARAAVAAAELLVLQSRFDPEGVLRAIQEYAITHVVMVPTMFVRLLKLPEEVRNRYDLSSLRAVAHTGGPCPVDIKRAMIDWWGPVITEAYGGTENGVLFACRSDEWLEHPGTVGRALPGTRFEIVDVETGSPVQTGEVGEVYACNPAYGEFEYLNLENARAAVSRGDLVTLGDMGFVDEDGYLYLTDRRRDMVISGGVNIYPAEVEAALILHPAVYDCAVFGIPDEDYGESLMAVVQLAEGMTATSEELQEFMRERLSNFKVPKAVRFDAQLPREDSGKILKRRLRDPYWESAQTSI